MVDVELEDDDSWMERAAAAQENGVCPVCFASDEAGHTEGCAWGQDVKRIAELHDARDAVEAELRDIEQYREETYTRAEKAEAKVKDLERERDEARAKVAELEGELRTVASQGGEE